MLFPLQRFDSDPETVMVLLDSAPETSVTRWMKPERTNSKSSMKQQALQSNFVVETDTEILIIESKLAMNY